MSAVDPLPNASSPEFISLCEAQVRIVQQGVQVDWCGVYLSRSPTQTEEPELIPLVLYPSAETSIYSEKPFLQVPRPDSSFGLLPSAPDTLDIVDLEDMVPYGASDEIQAHQQLVFPLVYQEIMLGVLVAGRQSAQWQSSEIAQLEEVAHTLAIACILDQRQRWYLQQLRQQQLRQSWEREHLDNLFHQLRNPLTALRTFSKLLLKRFWGDEKTQSVIEGISRESNHLQELLQAFEADLAQSDTEVTVPTWETETLQESVIPALLPSSGLGLMPIVLQEILEPILLSEQAIAQERQIQLDASLPKNLLPIQGNAAALREIFSNLIDNALKYTPSGGQVFVTSGLTTITERGQWQGVEIADTGYGIPLSDQDHIFERHYRGVQAEGEIPGTGLGLAIVKELVEKMQGRIELLSPNQLSQNPTYPGTTFTIWFLVAP
ncbi:MAG: GAF domain-containing sensor histidine kinase [Snowella sp.]|nr:GAF domain-containing sensor histidine kinase [Snowella sp.]